MILRAPLRDDNGPWVKPKYEATEWLSLFYGKSPFSLCAACILQCASLANEKADLVVVAVLTVFSTAHELSTPKAIPAFFS